MQGIRFVLACVLAAPLAQADIFVVDVGGGGDFTTLTAAVSAAGQGDVILVKSGFYAEPAPVVIDNKRLSIIGDEPFAAGAPSVEIQPGLVIKNLAPGRNVAITNVRLYGTPSTSATPATPALILEDNVSLVRIQDSALYGGGGADNDMPDGSIGVAIIESDSVAFVNSVVNGGVGQFSPALNVISGHGATGIEQSGPGALVLSDSYIDGGDGGGNLIGGWPYGGQGGVGVVKTGGKLFLVGTRVSGGQGGISHEGGDGGAGVVISANTAVTLMGSSSLNGGEGGWSDFGPDGADGEAVIGAGTVNDLGGEKRAMTVTTPLREGETGNIDLQGASNESALLITSLAPHLIPYVGYQGVLMLATPFISTIVVGAGNADVPFVVPELGPGFEQVSVFLQPAYVGPSGTQLGPGVMLTLFDSSF